MERHRDWKAQEEARQDLPDGLDWACKGGGQHLAERALCSSPSEDWSSRLTDPLSLNGQNTNTEERGPRPHLPKQSLNSSEARLQLSLGSSRPCFKSINFIEVFRSELIHVLGVVVAK